MSDDRDITERLADVAEFLGDIGGTGQDIEAINDAAVEVERLRAENTRLRRWLRQANWLIQNTCDQIGLSWHHWMADMWERRMEGLNR